MKLPRYSYPGMTYEQGIEAGAFADCTNLTEIYITSKALELAEKNKDSENKKETHIRGKICLN